MLLDREIKGRKKEFGIELYDHVQPMSTSQEFFESEDLLTATLRPPLLEAQREVAALEIRLKTVKEHVAQAEVTRRSAFPVKAQTLGEKMSNAGKSARLAANETKLKAELSSINTMMRDHKQRFGVKVFAAFKELEDTRGWLPSDRKIRSMYDNTCRDIEDLQSKRDDKENTFVELGGDPIPDPSRKDGKAINVHSDKDPLSGENDMNSVSNSSGMFTLSNPSTDVNAASQGTTTTNVPNAPGSVVDPAPTTTTTTSETDDTYTSFASFPPPGSSSTMEGSFLGIESTAGTVDHSSINADISSIFAGAQSSSSETTAGQNGSFAGNNTPMGTEGDFLS